MQWTLSLSGGGWLLATIDLAVGHPPTESAKAAAEPTRCWEWPAGPDLFALNAGRTLTWGLPVRVIQDSDKHWQTAQPMCRSEASCSAFASALITIVWDPCESN